MWFTIEPPAWGVFWQPQNISQPKKHGQHVRRSCVRRKKGKGEKGKKMYLPSFANQKNYSSLLSFFPSSLFSFSYTCFKR